MYSPGGRTQALELISGGHSLRSVSISMGNSRPAARDWRDAPHRALPPRTACPRCASAPALPQPHAGYAYLLGLYLGGGRISAGGNPANGVYKLRIACSDAWPGLIQECASAMRAVRPASKVMTQRTPGRTEVLSCSKHWPCFFPQHGPGMKHTRKIELAQWQQVIVDRYPGDFACGLFHSDGYRGVNRVRRKVAEGDRWYEYPRYLFTNKSADILGLCGAALDRLGVEWRSARGDVISVAKRDAVARLDGFVGPKY